MVSSEKMTVKTGSKELDLMPIKLDDITSWADAINVRPPALERAPGRAASPGRAPLGPRPASQEAQAAPRTPQSAASAVTGRVCLGLTPGHELSPSPACSGPQEQIELLKTPGLGDTATSALGGLCRIFSGRAPPVTRSCPRPRQPRARPHR